MGFNFVNTIDNMCENSMITGYEPWHSKIKLLQTVYQLSKSFQGSSSDMKFASKWFSPCLFLQIYDIVCCHLKPLHPLLRK